MVPTTSCSPQPISVLGTRDTMEAKISIETPFPTPSSVIRSPSHIKNAVPAVEQMPIVA
jgi:hypothetical protein